MIRYGTYKIDAKINLNIFDTKDKILSAILCPRLAMVDIDLFTNFSTVYIKPTSPNVLLEKYFGCSIRVFFASLISMKQFIAHIIFISILTVATGLFICSAQSTVRKFLVILPLRLHCAPCLNIPCLIIPIQ